MKKYFLHDGINQYGPFDLTELESKIITPQTMVWYDELPTWKPAAEIEELKNLLNSKVPASQILTPPVMSAKDEDWSKKMYYYTDNAGQQGPFTLEQLKSRPIQANTPVWYDPLPEWTTAEKVTGLKDIINHTQQTTTIVTQKKLYYYLDNAGQKQGPFELEQLKGKPINSATMVWYEPLPEWTAAGKVAELNDIISSAPQVTATPQKRSYYYLDSAGQKQGPFEFEQLKGKSINNATLVWYDPLPEWTAANKVAELKDIISNAPQVASTVTAQKRLYYYIDGAGQRQGPFDLEQMKGQPIKDSTLIWYDSLAHWKNAGSEESLKHIIGNGQPSAVDWSTKLFYYTDATGQQGPFTLDQLRGKPITATTPVWYDPLPQWTTAGQVEGLKTIIQ